LSGREKGEKLPHKLKSGFYLGYLRGRSFPLPQNVQLPPKKILLSLQYISNYIGKIIHAVVEFIYVVHLLTMSMYKYLCN